MSDSRKSGREYRHRRRVRNTILAYLSLVIIIAGIAAGGFFGVKALIGVINDKKAKIEEEQLALEQQREAEAEAEMQAQLEAEAEEEEEEVVEEESEYTEEDLLTEVVESYISEMSVEEKVAGLFIVTPEQLTGVDVAVKAGDGTKEAIEKYNVGGLVYSSKNIKDESQIKEMLANTVSYSKHPMFLAVNEGLGDDSVLNKPLKYEALKSYDECAAQGDSTNEYATMGDRLVTLGFNMVIGPNADLNIDGVESPLSTDTFGADTNLVSNLVIAGMSTLTDKGVTACVGHFPGQATADKDPAEGLSTTARTKDEMAAAEMTVFKNVIDAGAEAIMVSNVIAPELTGDETTPCSLSKEVITDILRTEYQYNGLVISDALNQAAIKDYYSSDDAAIKVLKAGADMVYLPEDFEAAYNAVVEAVKDGTISEQRINDSLARVFKIKYKSTIEE